MREIKFRAWDILAKKMRNVTQLEFLYLSTMPWTGQGRITDVRLEFEEFNYFPNEVELMQYTGLKDKNGKEIYEGDIVTAEWYSYEEPLFGTCGEVIYHNGRCAFAIWNENAKTMLELNKQGCYAFEIEVVGNIYENPELLNE